MNRTLSLFIRFAIILAVLLAALPLDASTAQAEGAPSGLSAAEWQSMQAQMAAAGGNLSASQVKIYPDC